MRECQSFWMQQYMQMKVQLDFNGVAVRIYVAG